MNSSKLLIKPLLFLLFSVLSMTLGAQKSRTVQLPACPLSSGGWKFIPELSDEFDGKRLDTAKWYPYNPGWKGREPGYFSPAARYEF